MDSNKPDSYKSDYQQQDTTTIHIEPFLMPIAVVLASCFLSTSMFASFTKLANSMKGSNSGNLNIEEAVLPSAGDTAPSNNPPSDPTTAVVSLDDDSVKGKSGAKIAIVEFSDYQCPFCKKFYDDAEKQIIQEYVDTGKAVLVYRDLPLSFHPFAQKQAEAAECAGEQGQYWAMHDYIFEKGGELGVDQLKAGAVELGLNASGFDSCLDNGDMVAEISKDSSDAAAAGINGTPGFVVGPISEDGTVSGTIISGAQPFDSFKTAIESYL